MSNVDKLKTIAETVQELASESIGNDRVIGQWRVVAKK